jgi:integrase
MARRARSPKLETRGARLKLPIAKKPVFTKIAPRVGLGYRRNHTDGTWVVRVANGTGGNWTKAIGVADDFAEADGNAVLDYWQAQDHARAVARANRPGEDDDGKPVIVAKALERYEADLEMRGGDPGNVDRVRGHLPDALKNKVVALLNSRELKKWRDGLAKSMAPASVNRTTTGLRAALNSVADHDERITNRQSWELGLAALRDATVSRNVILAEKVVRSIVTAAHQESPEFGLLVEVAAVTGARVSQLARLEVQDLQGERTDPRLMMPTSRKGRGEKKITRRPVPIPANLVARLRVAAAGRPSTAPLLMKARLHRVGDPVTIKGQMATIVAAAPDGKLTVRLADGSHAATDRASLDKSTGEPWHKSDHTRSFRRAAARAGQAPAEVTLAALRHSSIVRQLLGNVPIRVVAALHDTSVAMIEKTYSKFIADHSDALARPALLDVSTPAAADNVVPIGAAR